MATLTIDGRTVRADDGTTILEVARAAGIHIPTLCHHEALEPWGGCRLCLVDVTRPEWDGWRKAVVSCLAQSEDGLVVETQSERIRAARQVALDLLLARCPNTPAVQQLAAECGLEQTTYRERSEPDACILCGLCTRVCEAYATSAIATWGRGTNKAVGTFAHLPPQDCVGCGACAMVCPTGHIRAERSPTAYRIWDREFPTSACAVEQDRCVGCGACEEACPFAVARVALQLGGALAASIPAEHCRGCGACVGACPTGAIDQAGHTWRAMVGDAAGLARDPQPTVTVMSCGRSDLSRAMADSGVPPNAHLRLLEVPCTGRITAAAILSRLALGDHGVLALGRHQDTCRLRGAEDPAVEQVRRARELATIVGVEPARIAFVSPAPGREGPTAALDRFVQSVGSLGPVVSQAMPPGALADEGLDTALAALGWLSSHANARGDGAAWLAHRELPPAVAGKPALHAGDVPLLAALGHDLFRPTQLLTVLHDALAVLAALGWDEPGISVGGYRVLPDALRQTLSRASQVIALSERDRQWLHQSGVAARTISELVAERAAALPRPVEPVRIACDGSPPQVALLDQLGHAAVNVGPDPLPSRFALTAAARQAADARLRDAAAKGAAALLVGDPAALARWALLTRDGTWRASRVAVMLPHQVAAASLASRPIVSAIRPASRP